MAAKKRSKAPDPGDEPAQVTPPGKEAAAEQSPETAKNASFPVVGVGASAGGLEAFTQLLNTLPADTGMAFVFVPHLAPSHASMMAEILGRATTMPVSEVHDEPEVQPNCVYVIPPDRNMTIAQGKLKLLPRNASGQNRPIDLFFNSLAEDLGYKAIGVIFSGTATDGTLGLEAIKAEGGITFAQDGSAQQESMPRTAAAAGCVDFVLAPHEIAKEIARIARHPYVAPTLAPDAEGKASERHLARILQLLKLGTGVDFTHYRANTLYRRINRRLVLHKMEGLRDYVEFLQRNAGEVQALFQDILINVTSFFRNSETFELLKTSIFPTLVKDRSRHDPLRIWVLGCSTGEEAYSLAMAYVEFSSVAGVYIPAQIFATDVNGTGIDRARAGIYSKTAVQDLAPERLRRFFAEVDGSYRITKTIRDMCVFARHNGLTDPPFSRIDLISCRNLLIYLEPTLQQKLIAVLHYALKPRGYLWLGTSENLGSYRDLFEVEEGHGKFYLKKPSAARLPMALRSNSYLALPMPSEGKPGEAEGIAGGLVQQDLLREADRILLAKYAPPGVLVNADLEIMQFRGDTGPYLTPAPGKASLNLLKMARQGLLVGLRGAIHKARKEEAVVREEGLRVKSNGGYRDVNIEIVPIRGATHHEGCFLVLFEDLSPTDAPKSQDDKGNGKEASATELQTKQEANDRQITRLTQELAATREYLQSVIEQQEASNEELQSANEEAQSSNEELQSINEELETSKEEIQSSNEELVTVNDELQNRNLELSQSNNDLLNLLSSVQMVIVMLGQDLRIRRFTPAAEKVLNLIPADVGRPISDIKLTLDILNFEQLLTEAIDTISVKEQDVRDKAGHWYTLRIRPYRTMENKIDGAVLVLLDVDRLKRAHEYAESIVDSVVEPLLVLDGDLRVQRASRSYYEAFQTTTADTENRLFLELDRGQWNDPELRRELDEVRLRGRAMVNFELTWDLAPLGLRSMLVSARQLKQSSVPGNLILLSMREISERKRLEEDLRQQVEALASADRNKNEFLATLAHELRNPLAPLQNAVLALKTPGVDATAAGQLRGMMERQVQNMVRMIDDLLDMSRISQGKLQLRKEVIDLAEVVTRAAETTRHAIDARNQNLVVHLPSEPVWLEADPTRLEQVFDNLLTNASKFTHPDGHIQLTLELGGPRKGGTKANSEPLQAIARVHDDGVGIAPEMQTKVFQMFAQSERAIDRRHGGLGIGLFLVQRLAELHGGSVQVVSAGSGKGSEFVVRLPVLNRARADALLAAKPTEAPEADADKRRVLVVDDNVDAADSLAMLLQLKGHDVDTAHNGPAALEQAAASRPEVILLDIGLPGMNGYDVARRLRQQPATAKALLVALTGYGHDEDRRRAMQAGFDHHLTKPVDFKVLNALLVQASSTAS